MCQHPCVESGCAANRSQDHGLRYVVYPSIRLARSRLRCVAYPSIKIALEITVFVSRLCGFAAQQQHCCLERDRVKLHTSDRFDRVEGSASDNSTKRGASDRNQKNTKQGRRNPASHNTQEVQKLGHIVVGANTAKHTICGYDGDQFYMMRTRSSDATWRK